MIHKDSMRVRFAPSPTGHLHIGGLRTVIFNWLLARSNNGKFLLRIEDTDLERSKPEFVDSIMNSLKWMGTLPDENMVIQSERVPEHRRIATQMVEQGKAFYCFCSQEQVIERHKVKYGADDVFIKYDGQCRTKKVTEADLLQPHVIRFALPYDVKIVAWKDLVRDEIVTSIDQLDDFIIIRSDGMSMYNFACVLDDHFMRITHIIRGEEHVANTPKQILLYQALGYQVPQFGHVSMILGSSGHKLSKRDGATSVLEYKHMGYLPDALFNYLVRLGWAHGDQEIFNREELIKLFGVDNVSKKPAIFDQTKLDWVNAVYIKQDTPHNLWKRMVEDVDHPIFKEITWDDTKIYAAIGLYRERVKTLKELADELKILHGPEIRYLDSDLAQWVTPQTAQHLQGIIEMLEQIEQFNPEALSAAIKELAKKFEVKLVHLAQPIRIALVGKSASPGVFELLTIVGKQESIKRLKRLLGKMEQ
jgi:glutamyl-tRNA synthetase